MKVLTLSALALLIVGSVMVAPSTRAFDPGNCDFNTTDHNNVVAAPVAAFVNVKPSTTPGGVAPVSTPGSTPPAHVGSQQGVTPPVDAPAQPVPVGGSTPPVTGLPQAGTPGFVTSWTPDCITIASGDTVTWSNADGEALHGPWITGTHIDEAGKLVENNNCWKAPAGLTVPTQDRDAVSIAYNRATNKLDIAAASTRVANAGNPDGTSIKTVSCDLTEAGAAMSADGHEIVITYECILHRNAMTGHIHIKVPA